MYWKMKRPTSILFITSLFLFLLALLSIMVYNGLLREARMMTQLFRLPTQRDVKITTQPRPGSILMLNVIKGNDTTRYKTALTSQECYAKMHGYQFLVANSEDFDKCHQKDFMFKRHCIVVQLLPAFHYIIFLDADMAVVNFDKKWEEFIDPRFDIAFYERFFNWEFAAGSYIAKNSDWTIDFLTRFANYESQLPNSFHGTDNGALHIFVGMEMYPDLDKDFEICREIYKKSKNYTTLFHYEACVRSIMGSRRFSRNILVYKKGTSWVRDIWLTDSRWHPDRDFLLHALQEQNRRPFDQLNPNRPHMGAKTFHYYNPFKTLPKPAQCSSKAYKVALDNRLIIPLNKITAMLQKIEKQVEKERYEALGKIKGYL